MDDHQQNSGKCVGTLRGIGDHILRNLLTFNCVAAVVLGVIIGTTFDACNSVVELYMAMPVDVVGHMVKGATVPLMTSSMILAIVSYQAVPSKEISIRSGVYVIFTTLMSVTIGVALVFFVEPGFTGRGEEPVEFFTADDIYSLSRRLYPENLIRAFVQHHTLVRSKAKVGVNTTLDIPEALPETAYEYGVDILSLLVTTGLFGLALTKVGGEQTRVVVQTICSISKITASFIDVIRCYLPVGLLFMTVCHAADTVHGWNLVLQVLKFTALVGAGLFVHGAIILPLIYLVFTRRNPITLIRGVSPALWTAFVSSSSAATMPLTVHYCKKASMDHKLTRVLLNISTNNNNNGTALYQAAAAVFIAQLTDTDLDFELLFTIGVSAAVFSLAGNGRPACGAMMSIFVLYGADLALSNAWILVTVELILDHAATAVNVFADCIGVVVVLDVELRRLDLQQEIPRIDGFETAREEEETAL